MATNPPQAESLAYWLNRFQVQRREARDVVLQRLTAVEAEQALHEAEHSIAIVESQEEYR